MEIFIHAAGIAEARARRGRRSSDDARARRQRGNVVVASGHGRAARKVIVARAASWGAKRHQAFPDAPTLKEEDDVEFYVWSGVFVPKAVPVATVAILRER